MTNGDCGTVDVGGIRFYDLYTPALPVGDYRVDAIQTVSAPSVNEDYSASQTFSIAGPRWSLPAGDVFSVFPPSQAAGQFEQFLPHVVLSNPAVPWERDVFAGHDPSEQLPWMAVLVFPDGEQIGGAPALQAGPSTQSLSDLFTAPGASVLWPALTAEWYENAIIATGVCTTIDLSPAAFTAFVPGIDALPYLAHARQVDPTAKDSDVLRIAGDGWYSVVVASRLPTPGTSAPVGHSAHLVSLEGFTDYIDGTATLPARASTVRMISLCSWTFNCLPDGGESFEALATGLTTGATGQPTSTAFALPYTLPGTPDTSQQLAASALEQGYVPLSYQTRSGECTFGWYRGPASPIAVPRFVAQMPTFGTASAAMIYDKPQGVFDISYAVAWEIGRMLGLSDSAFACALVSWRREGHRLIDLILERGSQVPALQGFDPDDPDAVTEQSLLDTIRAYAISDDFMHYLIGELGTQLAPADGVPVQGSALTPFPPYSSLTPPQGNPQTIADVIALPEVQQAVREAGGAGLAAIADWLAQRYLLIGVPFAALVANADLLPPESVRFFHVDVNWLDTLIEGALSTGIESSRDIFYQDLMRDLVYNTALGAVNGVRLALLGQGTDEPPTDDPPEMAGVLLRSALVTGWPGLEIRGWTGDPDTSTEIPLLRMDRLTAGVMLCLWPQVPTVVTVDEPSEGIAFGFEDPPTGNGDWLYLRSLDESDYGTPLDPTKYGVDPSQAIGSDRVVSVSSLLTEISGALPGSPQLAPRDFAVELIRPPERIVFGAGSAT